MGEYAANLGLTRMTQMMRILDGLCMQGDVCGFVFSYQRATDSRASLTDTMVCKIKKSILRDIGVIFF